MMQWAQPPANRYQAPLLAPTLDERLGQDHGIRLLDQLLNEVDWSCWEANYAGEGAGRPPIHPRWVAGAILYGLLKKIRSTRDLEEATRMRLDFRWFLNEMVIDHTTFCVFRTRFHQQMEELFKALNRRAAQMRKVTLEQILIDGTRLRANSDRHGARTAQGLSNRLAALESQMSEALGQLAQESQEAPGCETRAQLEQRLEQLNAQKSKLEKALEVAKQRDEKKRRKDGAKAQSVRVPVTDTDSCILPNKEGGYAPNYTPVVATDKDSGLILAACIAQGNAEAESVGELVSQVQDLGSACAGGPTRIAFDGGFGTGQNLQALKEQGIEVYAPIALPQESNPAIRADPTQPVAEERREALPMRGAQIDRAAFIYDQAHDRYHCPMGRALLPARTLNRGSSSAATVAVTEYRCADCSGCPLRCRCLGRNAQVRTILRDEFEPLREQVAQRMATPQGKAIYAHRAPGVEGVFGHIKAAFDLRRFSRRGTAKVRADWFWMCTAFNLMKLIRHKAAQIRAGAGRSSALRPALSAFWRLLQWLRPRLAALGPFLLPKPTTTPLNLEIVHT